MPWGSGGGGSGYPPPGGGYLTGYPPGGGTQVGQQKEYSLHGGRYASCVHAGGLSCLFSNVIESFPDLIDRLTPHVFPCILETKSKLIKSKRLSNGKLQAQALMSSS